MRASLLLCFFLAGCNRHRDRLPIIGETPPFAFTDQSGKIYDRSALDGHVWLADFVYTTCPGPCPRMTSEMRAIQDRTPAQIHFVSFSVDPENDTPPVLTAYAKKFGADESRWRFLTGDKNQLGAIARDGFKLASGVDHSTYFVLVDRRGHIRGYYGVSGGSPVEKIVADAADLLKEGD